MKNRTTAGIFALLLGGLGVHKFYLGKVGTGIIYLIFCWSFIPALLALIEGIQILTMTDDQFDAKYNGISSGLKEKQDQYDNLVIKKNLIIDEAEIILKSDLEKGNISKEMYEVRKKQLDIERKLK